MDLQPTHHLEAASSSSTTLPQLPQSDLLLVPNASTSTPITEQKPIRSSARVKAARQKEKERDQPKDRDSDSADQSAHPSWNPRSSKATTSKNKRSRESTSSSSLTINEPIQDRKGKKRAAPEADSEEESSSAALSSSAKRTKTSTYSLRSRIDTSTSSASMPKKTKSATKGKVAAKARGGPSSSASRLNDDDIDMLDASMMRCDNPARADDRDNYGNHDEDVDIRDNEANHGDGEGDNHGDDEETSPPGGIRSFAGLDESAAMAIFGDYRQFGSYMVSLSGRLKTMLNNIKATASPATRLVTLQELSELLSISTEDTLAGSFQVEDFVGELVKILGGRGVNEDEDDRDDGDEQDDAAVSSALVMNAGVSYQGDENLEAQVLACRCLANLMEALPGVAHTVVYHGAIPVLCSKLIEISYIDLAEQTLSTLEKISEEFPSSIVRENGLAALLSYLDFFSIAVQRTALQAAANCCRNISSDHYPMIRGVWSIIRDCLGYSDQRLVEFACLCVIRVIDSYHRASTENLENLLDESAIRAINALLLPSGGSQMIAANTYTLLLRALATATRASPKITVTLLQADVVDTLYQILTGVLPSATTERSISREDVTHVTVMENLAHRPKDQVEEALSLVSELMPPLPKDGVFDHKGYTDKALARMVKAKSKAERAASRQAASLSSLAMTPPDLLQHIHLGHNEGNHESDTPIHDPEESSHAVSATDPVSDRTELLRSKPDAVGRFMRLIVPVLIDVYAASVITPIRIKTLTGLLRRFASSILSSKDHPSLVIGALQLVDLLLQKVPTEYRPALRREGVFHEIEAYASRTLSTTKSKDKEKDTSDLSATPPPPPMSIHLSSIPGYRKFHSLVIRFKYSVSQEDSDGDSSDEFRRLVAKLSAPDATEQVMVAALRDFAEHLTSNGSVSSFELLQSGAVEGLLRFATDSGSIAVKRRRELLFEAFTKLPRGGNSGQSPFAVLVKRLQESLTRMENFEVISIAQGSDDSKRSSPSLLARQLRLRLVTDDDSDIPRNLQNMVALNDYLRPRVAGILSNGRLSNMLAALAASGFGPGSVPRAPFDAEGQPSRAPEPLLAPVASSDASTPSTDRLSAKNTPFAAMEPPADTIPSTPVAPRPGGSRREDALISDSGYPAQLTDDEVDAEVYNNYHSTVNVISSVCLDGGRVEAQTPDGTRIATPNSARDVSTTGRSGPLSKSSYAAALKAKPIDWHLEFSMDDHILPLDLTIYGAIHQHEMRKKTGSQPSMKFRKVNGPPTGSEAFAKIRSPSPTLSSLPEEAAHAKILRLLRVLHKLNAAELERPARPYECRALPESAFINNKLTAKLTRQLEEPMIVASSCLPDWAIDLPQNFPFLFPFTTRYNYLQSTSFGYARLILKWQSQQGRGQDSLRRDDGIGFLGRLQRQKVRISRKHILESAVKVFELYGSSSSILEVEYFEEVGTGLGPTLEFYSLASKEFARRDLKIWRDADANSPGAHVHHPTGLYPAPISPDDIANDGGQKRTHILRVIGQYVAKAMLDSRIIDLSFNKIFIKLVLGEEVPFTIETLRLVDNDLANSLAKLQGYASMKGQNEKLFRKVALIDIVNVEDLALDFTLPGYDIELRPGGRNISVTSENVEQYIHDVLDTIIGSGVQLQAKVFREGFSKVFPISDLQAFSADELVMLFGNSDEDWSVETLSEAIKADHGFHGESRSIRELIELVAEFDVPTRRDYLQFITGSPKLPIGGFRGLNPPLTVVRKPAEPPNTPDAYLPSVMTCVNYLKLPEYSSKKIMKERLLTAIKEGVGSFHLS
ncbi:ubiquitin-protein ligase [Pisolithus marmoratus]|nr:ubiquitin-protein ligase [Pisolithus marmoratus]